VRSMTARFFRQLQASLKLQEETRGHRRHRPRLQYLQLPTTSLKTKLALGESSVGEFTHD
jgi:hypothetical protein